MRKNNSKLNFTKNRQASSFSRRQLKISKCSISIAQLSECSNQPDLSNQAAFSTWPKSHDKNLHNLRTKSFEDEIKSIFYHIWRTFNETNNVNNFQICLLAELAMMMPSSNSPVEHVFSILTTILMDWQLTMAHKTMESCILSAGDKTVWISKKKRKFSTALPENILVWRTNKKDLGKKRTWERTQHQLQLIHQSIR